MKDYDKQKIDKIYNLLIKNNYFTIKELQLVIKINGYTMKTLNDCCYARYGEMTAIDLLMIDNIIDPQEL